MGRGLTQAEKKRVLQRLHADRIWLSCVRRLAWMYGLTVRPYLFQPLLQRLGLHMVTGIFTLLWLFLGGLWLRSWLFWLLPCIWFGADLVLRAGLILPASWTARFRAARLVNGLLATLTALGLGIVWVRWMRDLPALSIFATPAPPPTLLLMVIVIVSGLSSDPFGYGRKRRYLRRRQIETWPDYVRSALKDDLVEVF